VVWAIVIVGLLACSATGVVTLFGSKFAPLFGMSPEALAKESAVSPKRRTISDFAAERPTDAGEW
jgi:hypothetical protein